MIRLGLAGAALLIASATLPVARVTPARASPALRGPLDVEGATTQGALLRGRVPAGARVTFAGLPVATRDGGYIIGLDRDAPASATLAVTMPDGQRLTRTLAIAPRAWAIERVPGAPRIPVPDADFARRRPGELAQIAAARAVESNADGWAQRFIWPARGRLSGLFGAQRSYANGEKGSYHAGADIVLPTGARVVAPADGVVVLAAAAPFTLEGNLLLIDHGMGLSRAFLHLSRIDVRVGDHVVQGQSIAAVGATGRASGPHLHWALKWHDARLDPLLVAGAM